MGDNQQCNQQYLTQVINVNEENIGLYRNVKEMTLREMDGKIREIFQENLNSPQDEIDLRLMDAGIERVFIDMYVYTIFSE